ncbi:MAG: GNAT family N-acetyltransferase [Pseudomonadota bacterium]
MPQGLSPPCASRPATPDDIPHLAHFQVMAGDGHMEALYHDLVPGKSVTELVARRFSFEGSTKSYRHCHVAELGDRVVGGLHCHPFDAMANDPSDPLVPEERFAVVEAFDHLDFAAVGTFHINVVAVYPEFQGQGIGTFLIKAAITQAQSQGFTKASLAVFEENAGALRLYQRHGFKEAARHPGSRHPMVKYDGDLLMMVARD